jgi:antitoxin component of RelBE/YafQ-DinJ toxin-antitoxin module
MIVRIDPELKTKVNNLAKTEGKSISEVVRGLLEDYVKDRDIGLYIDEDRDIGLYIDDLWKRISTKLTSRGFGPKDIKRVIQEVRTKK